MGEIKLGEICLLVLDFLRDEKGFSQSFSAFQKESSHLVKHIQKSGNASVKSLSLILNEYVQLKEERRKKESFANTMAANLNPNQSDDESFSKISFTFNSIFNLLEDYSTFKSAQLNNQQSIDTSSHIYKNTNNANTDKSSKNSLKRKKLDSFQSVNTVTNVNTQPNVNSNNNNNNSKANDNGGIKTTIPLSGGILNFPKKPAPTISLPPEIHPPSTTSKQRASIKTKESSSSRRKNLTPKKLSISPSQSGIANISHNNHHVNTTTTTTTATASTEITNTVDASHTNTDPNAIPTVSNEPIPMLFDNIDFNEIFSNPQIHEKIAGHINHFLHGIQSPEIQPPIWDDSAQHQNNLDILNSTMTNTAATTTANAESNIINTSNNQILDNILTSMESDPEIGGILFQNQLNTEALLANHNTSFSFDNNYDFEDMLLTPGSTRRPYKSYHSTNKTPKRIQFSSNPSSRETSPNNNNINNHNSNNTGDILKKEITNSQPSENKLTTSSNNDNNNTSDNTRSIIPEDVDEFLSTLNYD